MGERLYRKDYYNKKQIKERGWSETLIKKYLKNIELVEFEGLYRDKPQKCYLKEIIENIEKQDGFEKELEKVKIRSEHGELIAEKKKQSNIEELKKHLTSITIEKLDDKELMDCTLRAKQDWYFDTNQYDYYDVYSAPPETKQRWVVNFIRHNLTEYDDYIDNIYRKVGVGELYNILHNYVLDLISEKYPKYKNECERQKEYNRDI